MIVLCAAIAAQSSAQYGYMSTYDTAKYAAALRQDLADGVLDQNLYPELKVSNWIPTYYVRGGIELSSVQSVAPIVTGVLAQRTRIVQGIGIRSDRGRWRPLTSTEPTDPWRDRFIHAGSNPVYYVDLGQQGVLDVYGGWPSNSGVWDDRANSFKLDSESVSTRRFSALTKSYYPMGAAPDSLIRSWVCSLDYNSPTERVYNAPLNYSREHLPDPNRNFYWTRSGVVSDDPRTILYPAAAERTPFAWEVAGSGVTKPDTNDLRAIIYPINEFIAYNAGVRSVQSTANGLQVRLADNVFALFQSAGAPTQRFDQSQRFALINAPEFLQRPGDMVISYSRRRIYFIPYSTTGISAGVDDNAQVLNVSVATPISKTIPKDQWRVYAAPLMVHQRPGFTLENVDFSTCAGCAISIGGVSDDHLTTAGMTLSNCRFTSIGLVGVESRDSWATSMLGSEFSNIDGVAISIRTESYTDPTNRELSYRAHYSQLGLNDMIIGCNIRSTGRLHPSLPAVMLALKPCAVSIMGNTFSDTSGIAISGTGTRHQISSNSFVRCSADVAEAGVVTFPGSITNLGNVITRNGFYNCKKCPEFGRTQFDPFLAGVMLDDGASGVTVSYNNFRTTEIPVYMNGGMFNRIEHNRYTDMGPTDTSQTKPILQGYTTLRGLSGVAGGAVVGSPTGTLVSDTYLVSDSNGPFGGLTWTNNFSQFGSFANTTDYFGPELSDPAAMTWTKGVPRWNYDYWFGNTARRDKWFFWYKNSMWAVRSRGNRFIYSAAEAGANAPDRFNGHVSRNDIIQPWAFSYTEQPNPHPEWIPPDQ